MPVWNSSTSTGGGSSGGDGGGDRGGDGGGFDVNRVVENIAERAINDPQFKVQIANAVENAGIPPRLIFEELGTDAPESVESQPRANPDKPMTESPNPNPNAESAGESVESETMKITPADVNDFLDEVEAVLGPDATIADLQALDDGMVQTALDMSDLPS